MFVTPRAVAALIVLVLIYIVVVHAVSQSRQIIPIDFYQYWGAAAARRLSTETLGSPYREAHRYGAVLLEAAEGSGDPMFQRVSRHATPPNFTATPLAYTLFALLPANYTQASLLYLSLQIVLFIAAVIIVGVVYGYPAFPLVCLSLLLMLSSGPLNSDLRLGNLGCVQFIILAIVLALADRLRDARPSGILGGIVLSGVTLLVLTKPNVALVLVFMVLHLWVARGTRFLVMAAWPAALCGGAAVILSSLYFGSWTVWQEWYDAVLGLTRVGHRPGTGGHHERQLLHVGSPGLLAQPQRVDGRQPHRRRARHVHAGCGRPFRPSRCQHPRGRCPPGSRARAWRPAPRDGDRGYPHHRPPTARLVPLLRHRPDPQSVAPERAVHEALAPMVGAGGPRPQRGTAHRPVLARGLEHSRARVRRSELARRLVRNTRSTLGERRDTGALRGQASPGAPTTQQSRATRR